MTNVTVQAKEALELLAKKLEVLLHPAWYGSIDERTSVALLEGMPAMTYLIRQASEDQYSYWLSHKREDGTIAHRPFKIRLFPRGLCFMNCRAPACEYLDAFIQGALACKE